MIQELLVKSKNEVISPNGRRPITFSRQGFQDDPEFVNWEVKNEQGQTTLLLYGDSGVLARLIFDKDHWSGRDVRGGVTEIIPEDTFTWKQLMVRKTRPIENKPVGYVNYAPVQYKLSDRFDRNKKSAIALVGCSRVGYFKDSLNSITANKLRNYDLYCFIDRPFMEEEIKFQSEVAGLAKAYTNRIVEHPTNFGCGRTMIDARKQLFDMEYEKVFVFEDDMTVSPTYIKYCENLLSWGQDHYPNVGAVQGWSKCLLSPGQKPAFAQQVYATYGNWWGYLMPRETWKKMEPFMLEYMDRFLNTDYANRPIRSILEWFKPYADSNFKTVKDGFIPDEQAINARRRLFDSIPSGQDAATWLALDKEGLVRLAPTVNRARYIGELGIHQTPYGFKRDKFDRVTLDLMPEDPPKEFFPR